MDVNKTLPILVFLGCFFITAGHAFGADTDVLANVLKKIDQNTCKTPRKNMDFYAAGMVIISDDKRVLPENRIKDYEGMISQLEDMKCSTARKVLAGNVGDKVGYLLVDEMISVSSRLSTDERQHSVCTYAFVKQGSHWKVKQEHCSSLPDYTIVPGDDALYYFHNPVY